MLNKTNRFSLPYLNPITLWRFSDLRLFYLPKFMIFKFCLWWGAGLTMPPNSTLAPWICELKTFEETAEAGRSPTFSPASSPETGHEISMCGVPSLHREERSGLAPEDQEESEQTRLAKLPAASRHAAYFPPHRVPPVWPILHQTEHKTKHKTPVSSYPHFILNVPVSCKA